MSLNLLRSILRQPRATAVASEMPADELRFVIELAATPDAVALHTELAGLLQSSSFTLEPLFASSGTALDRFQLLRIDGVARTLPADALFETAYALASALQAVSVEPDVGSRFFELPVEPDPRQASPEVADAVRGLCFVDTEPPPNREWALESTRVPGAWAVDPKQGAGILIAQPDTGVVPGHLELAADALDLERGHNVLQPGQPPVDPLTGGMANPGHGTGTASVVSSRKSGVVTGAAPQARVAPIRCINDVKVFDAAPVARAIDHARRSGCHVISMSLGGVPSRALHAALRAAVADQLIVLAAAGNCVRFVVWPARYNECIAVAGTNIDAVPWKGSCRGRAVDVSAPAENVWRADPLSNTSERVSAGQGTSFAVAITAGVAALWLAHHGRERLIALAQARGTNLQDLLRAALAHSARRPPGWDRANFGAGVVDAAALLALDPAQLPLVRKELAPADDSEVADLIAELSGGPTGAPPAGFDWPRYGLELANVLMEESRRASRARAGANVEAGLQAYRPSRTLTQALEGSSSPLLESVAGTRAVTLVPTLRIAPQPQAGGKLRLLAANVRSDGRESAGAPLSVAEATAALANGGDQLIERALGQLDRAPEPDAAAKRRLQEALTQHGKQAVTALSRGAEQQLNSVQRASLEALIKLTGRPALRVRNHTIDFNDAQLGQWQGALLLLKPEIPSLTRSVGRIDLQGNHVGTGFMIAEDLVMTNRHVLEVLAMPLPGPVSPKRWVLTHDDISIDFRREQGSGETARFAIVEVLFSGPTPTNDTLELQLTDLDVAILRIEPRNAAGQSAPPALPFLKGELESHASPDVLVIGFPARPATLPLDSQGQARQDVLDALRRIYGLQYGVKYLSPGSVSTAPGEMAGDTRRWVFGHDATTLGGNSGSCVVRYGPQPGIIGLHFAGEFERANYAHAMQRLVAGEHLPGAVLERLKWIQE